MRIISKVTDLLKFKIFIPFCMRSGFLSNLYYLLFSSNFSREHKSVLTGMYYHHNQSKHIKVREFKLRRQIHRIEKGLSMTKRRKLFAVDYIENAVANLKFLVYKYQINEFNDYNSIGWAYDVMQYYFEVIGDHQNVEMAKNVFNKIEINRPTDNMEESWKPYPQKQLNKKTISFNDLQQLALKRRSVRYYKQKKVPRNLILKAIEIAALSPSACNRQPFEYMIFDQTTLKNKVGSLPKGITPFYDQIPVFVVLVGKLSAYEHERDRHIIYIDGGLSAMSFMYALESLGLSSVPINWPDIEKYEIKLNNLLQLEKDERPIMLIGLGYADPEGMIPYSKKKSIEILGTFHE